MNQKVRVDIHHRQDIHHRRDIHHRQDIHPKQVATLLNMEQGIISQLIMVCLNFLFVKHNISI